MYKQVLQSVVTMICISIIIALPFYSGGFWKVFTIALASQPFLSWALSVILDRITDWKLIAAENEQLELLSKHTINIPCPGCKNMMSVPVFCGEENEVTCEMCDSDVIIDVALTPIIKTKIIDNNVTVRDIFEKITTGEETAYNESNDSKEK